jgi:hypothetical protein
MSHIIQFYRAEAGIVIAGAKLLSDCVIEAALRHIGALIRAPSSCEAKPLCRQTPER